MKKRIFIATDCGDDIRNDVFKYDYTSSLDKYMNRDEYGFWHLCGLEIILEQKSPSRVFYKEEWSDVAAGSMLPTNQDEEITQIREQVNSNGLEVILIWEKNLEKSPVTVICLGGPIIPIPDFMSADSIYRYFIQQGYALVIPLRRGISGISVEWEQALEGHYGGYDIEKTYISNWDVPVLLVHHLNDTTTWVGQSVAAYNDALKLKKQVALLIVQGPHTYDIPNKKILFHELTLFFNNFQNK